MDKVDKVDNCFYIFKFALKKIRTQVCIRIRVYIYREIVVHFVPYVPLIVDFACSSRWTTFGTISRAFHRQSKSPGSGGCLGLFSDSIILSHVNSELNMHFCAFLCIFVHFAADFCKMGQTFVKMIPEKWTLE